jgi:hypothetical protein
VPLVAGIVLATPAPAGVESTVDVLAGRGSWGAAPENILRTVPIGAEADRRAPAHVAEAGLVVWAVGDSCDSDHEPLDCDDVGRLITNDPDTDAVLALGDLQYNNGSLANFNRFYDPKMGSGKGLKAITFPAPGNHEYLTSGAAGYFDYWQARAGDRRVGYYGVTLAGWQIVAANSNCSQVGGCGASSRQGRFMAAYLERSGACELVFDHHPAFSDGGQGDSSEGKALFNLAYQHHGELFLSGHDHNYQRFAPRLPGGTVDARGVRQFVVGTGGKDLRGFRPNTRRTQYRQNSNFGALRIVLKPTGYAARFVSLGGTVMDATSGTCRP